MGGVRGGGWEWRIEAFVKNSKKKKILFFGGGGGGGWVGGGGGASGRGGQGGCEQRSKVFVKIQKKIEGGGVRVRVGVGGVGGSDQGLG